MAISLLTASNPPKKHNFLPTNQINFDKHFKNDYISIFPSGSAIKFLHHPHPHQLRKMHDHL